MAAARALRPRPAARLRAGVTTWPASSPAALDAWLLLVTSKEPSWRDPLLGFPDGPPTLGTPHEGWFYPDPIGFWAEARRWVTEVVRRAAPAMEPADALAIAGLVHLSGSVAPLALAMRTCRPSVVLFLDEPAWVAAGWDVRQVAHHVPDPHRPGQVYQGFWGRQADGTVVGKAPQHPSAHRFYRLEDMTGFLRAWR